MMNEEKVNSSISASQKNLTGIFSTANLIEPEIVIGSVPPYISIHWYLNIFKPLNPHYRTMSCLYKVFSHLDSFLLEKTMKHLMIYHDILRSRFFQEKGEWQHVILEPDKIDTAVATIDLSSVIEIEHTARIEALALEFQSSLNLSAGPLFRIAYIDLGSQKPGRLLFVIHHVLIDGFSMPILLNDFLEVYLQLSNNKPVYLPRKTVSFKHWAARLNEYAQLPERGQELDYWLRLPWDKVVPLPLDYAYSRQNDTIASSAYVEHVLSVSDTFSLLRGSNIAKVSFIDILLTAFVHAFTRWTGSPLVPIGIVNHARLLFEDLGVFRTIGFFALCQDILLELIEAHTFMDTLQSIKKQLETFPSKGFGKEILSCLSKDSSVIERLQTIPRRQVLLNYLGRENRDNSHSSFVQAANETLGPGQDPRNVRLELLYFSGIITQNQFLFRIEYSENVHKLATIETLAQYFIEAVEKFLSEIN